MMKLVAIAGLSLSALLASPAALARVDVGVNIGVPFYGPPVYYSPAPVYYGPRVVYYDYYEPHYHGHSYCDARHYYEGRGYYRGDDYRRYDGRGDDHRGRGHGRGHGHGHHDHDD